jgi:hypothetical protein
MAIIDIISKPPVLGVSMPLPPVGGATVILEELELEDDFELEEGLLDET